MSAALLVGDRACILDGDGLRLWTVGHIHRNFGLSPSAWAAQNQLHVEIVNGFLRGSRAPSPVLLSALGWEQIVLYRKAAA